MHPHSDKLFFLPYKDLTGGTFVRSFLALPELRANLCVERLAVHLCVGALVTLQNIRDELLHVSHYLVPFGIESGAETKLLMRGPEHVMTAKQILWFLIIRYRCTMMVKQPYCCLKLQWGGSVIIHWKKMEFEYNTQTDFIDSGVIWVV